MKSYTSLIAFLVLLFTTLSADAQINNPNNIPLKWDTDTTRTTVPLSEFQVVMPAGSFPELNYPAFVGKEEGLRDYFAHEPVIAVNINGEQKAYPLNVLTMHEMSNDSCGGVPILPTFCPLCNSSVVYDRRLTVDDKEYVFDFEVSGMLRHSDMVMVDQQTHTWWQQLMGEGLVGELAGSELNVVSSMILSVEEFFDHYPNGKILSHHPGTEVEKMYGHNPYVHYDSAGHLPFARYFDTTSIDHRLAPMERIISLRAGDNYRIYPFTELAKSGVVNDDFENRNLVVFYEEEVVSVLDEDDISKSKTIGSATVFMSKIDGKDLLFKMEGENFVDSETGSSWDITGLCIDGSLKGTQLFAFNHTNHFAFAWLSFYPDSDIYKRD